MLVCFKRRGFYRGKFQSIVVYTGLVPGAVNASHLRRRDWFMDYFSKAEEKDFTVLIMSQNDIVFRE